LYKLFDAQHHVLVVFDRSHRRLSDIDHLRLADRWLDFVERDEL
jgi:hypothetical protein